MLIFRPLRVTVQTTAPGKKCPASLTRQCEQLGDDTQLAKMDIKQAYQLVPVQPDDRRLLCIQWQEMVYVDKCLPLGLRSALMLFSAVADAIQGMMQLHVSCMILIFSCPRLAHGDEIIDDGDPREER